VGGPDQGREIITISGEYKWLFKCVKVGIICPCDTEYQSYKEILKLHNEAELASRLISSRREKDVEVIKVGNIASGEKDVNNKELRQELNHKLGAIACNWETSSVLKTAQLNGIKSFSFRVITDNADEEMEDNLNANWKKALEIMYKALEKFIFEGWVNKIN